jgi:large-conductance mechanosensitive channel
MSDFASWINERNFGLLIVGVLLVGAVKSLGDHLTNDVISPAFYHCASFASKRQYNQAELQKLKRAERVLLHVLEFVFTILIIYLISRFILRHRPQTSSTANLFTENELNEFRDAARGNVRS